MKAVIAESFERIHRSNLVGMGVLPLQFKPGENALSLGLTGRELFTIEGTGKIKKPGTEVTVRASREDGSEITFQAIARLDTPIEIDYYRNGGILHNVLYKQIQRQQVILEIPFHNAIGAEDRRQSRYNFYPWLRSLEASKISFFITPRTAIPSWR